MSNFKWKWLDVNGEVVWTRRPWYLDETERTVSRAWTWSAVKDTLLDDCPKDVLQLIWAYKKCMEKEADREWRNYRARCVYRCIQPERPLRYDTEALALAARESNRDPPDGWFFIFERLDQAYAMAVMNTGWDGWDFSTLLVSVLLNDGLI